MKEYTDAKLNILKYQSPDDLAVLGLENDVTRSFESEVVGECRWFSRLRPVNNGACLDEQGRLCVVNNGEAVPVVAKDEVALRGLHNVENLLAAFAAVRDVAGVETMAEVARTFTGVTHRIEPVRDQNGVQWFNDSIATSPSRVVAGLRAFTQPMVLIAGGYDKNIPFEPMAQEMIGRVRVLILTGPAGPRIEQALRAQEGFAEKGPKIMHAENMAQAVELAKENAKGGEIVSLSPGCSSFDAYRNFEARGDHYKSLVRAL